MNDENQNPFQIESSIPVLRMLDEAKSKAFYLDFLGYQTDWEHRFQPENTDSPLYMQISQGDSVIHLNGHADEKSPTAEVRIPVVKLDEYCQWLGDKCQGTEKPEVVDPRYTGKNTDMNLEDPSGNMLTFWLAEHS